MFRALVAAIYRCLGPLFVAIRCVHPDVLFLATFAYPAYLAMPTCDLWPSGHKEAKWNHWRNGNAPPPDGNTEESQE